MLGRHALDDRSGMVVELLPSNANREGDSSKADRGTDLRGSSPTRPGMKAPACVCTPASSSDAAAGPAVASRPPRPSAAAAAAIAA